MILRRKRRKTQPHIKNQTFFYYMDNKNKIIDLVYRTGEIKEICSKFCKDETLCADLIQEVTLIMLQKDETLIYLLNSRGELLYYINKVVRNQFNSKTSPFYKQFKKLKTIEYDAEKI